MGLGHRKSGEKHKKGDEQYKGGFSDTISPGCSPSVSMSPEVTDREFEKQFEKFLRENVPDPKAQEAMRHMPKENKWKLIASADAMKSNSFKTDERLKRMESNISGNPSIEALESLKLDIDQSDSSVIDLFIKKVGFRSLLGLLVKYSLDEEGTNIPKKQNIVISILRSIINFKIFFTIFAKDPLAVKSSVLTLGSRDEEVREKALELLISLTATDTGSGPVVDYLETWALLNGKSNPLEFCLKFVERKERSTSVLYVCMFLNTLIQTSPLSTRSMLFKNFEDIKLMDKLIGLSKTYKLDLERRKLNRQNNKNANLDPTIRANEEEVMKRYENIMTQVSLLKKSKEEMDDEIKKMKDMDCSIDNFNKVVESLIYDMSNDLNKERFEETIRNLKYISSKVDKNSGGLTWRAIESISKMIADKVISVNKYMKSDEYKESPVTLTDDIWNILKLYGFDKPMVSLSDKSIVKGQHPIEELDNGRYSLSREYFKDLKDKAEVKYEEMAAKATSMTLSLESLQKENKELKTKITELTNELANSPKTANPSFDSMPKFMENGENKGPAMGAESSGPAMGKKPAMGGGPAMGKPAMSAEPATTGTGTPAMGKPAMGKPAMGKPAMGGGGMGKPAMGGGAGGGPAMGAPKMGGMGAPKMGGGMAMGAPKMGGMGGMGAPKMGGGGMGAPKMSMGAPVLMKKPTLPKKKNDRPDVRVKMINWEKIADMNVEKTFWKQYGTDDEVVPLDEIKKEFSLEAMDAMEQVSGESAAESAKISKHQALKIIDGTKSKNMSIALTRTRRTCEEIRDAVLNMDEKVLSKDHLESLEKNAIPDQEDINKVREYVESNPDDKDKLPLAERFVYIISSVPKFDQRIKNWAFSLSFESQVSTLTKELNVLTLVLTALKDSKKFKKFLRITLAIGNYMNGGTAKGGAYGFKLGTLASLRNCKDIHNKRTLLNYILDICYNEDKKSEVSEEWKDYEASVKEKGYDNLDLRDFHSAFLEESQPILGFIVEFSLFPDAKNIGIVENKKDMNELKNNFDNLKNTIDVIKLGDPSDPYVTYMEKFVDTNTSKMENAVRMSTEFDELFKSVCTEFGENTAVLTPSDLMDKMATFVHDCEISLNENNAEREKALMARKNSSKSESENKSKTGAASTAGEAATPSASQKTPTTSKVPAANTSNKFASADASYIAGVDGNDGGAGLLDDLMSALSDGDGFKTLRRRRH